ncbi:MAG: hypothetical protein HRU15_13225 [Planctomycetes bacterium]|nr:hypothetical protein [Planctomycetota bacterium]
MDQDNEHLNLLKIFHYVLGGIGCIFSCFPLIHVAMGLFVMSGGFQNESMQGPPESFGLIFVISGSVFFLLGQIISIMILLSAKYIGQRKNHSFSFVIACLSCLAMPLGTILGVFTIIVLSKESVKKLYHDAGDSEAGGHSV